MNNAPLVSVLVPVLRADRFLSECFTSVANSELQDLELVVVTPRKEFPKIEKIASETAVEAKLVLVEDTGTNLASAMNLALTVCRGEFVARLDADDRMAEDRLSKQVAFLRTRSRTVLVGSQVSYICEHGVTTGRSRYKKHIRGGRQSSILVDAPVAHPAVMLRTKTLQQVGGYDPRFDLAEDLALWNRLIKLGNFDNLDFPLVSYRQHSGQISSTSAENIKKFALIALAVNESKQVHNIPDTFTQLAARPFGQILSDWKYLSRNYGFRAKVETRRHVYALVAQSLMREAVLARDSGSLLAFAGAMFKKQGVALVHYGAPVFELICKEMLRQVSAKFSLDAANGLRCTLCVN